MNVIYRTIMADPPWDVKAGPLCGREGFLDCHKGQTRPLAYPTMTIEAMKALKVGRLANPDGAHLYLCTINRYVEEAYELARAWGFTPSTMLVWAKNTMGGGLGGAFGLSTEFILFARRGKLPTLQREPGSWFNWKRPYDERGKPKHSAKPADLYQLIERVSPGPRLELFARMHRPGWDCWGNEVVAPLAVEEVLR